MKKLKVKNSIVITFLVFLILSGCYHFDFVNQPYTADANSFFEVEIKVSYSLPSYGVNPIYFGILLPIGWTTTNSIEYINDTTGATGFIVYSESRSQQMSAIDPPPQNYYWWVGVGSDSVVSGANTFTGVVSVFTDSQTGNFFLDYMLGDDQYGMNDQRSDDHLIIVGEVMGCFPESIVFANQVEIDNFQTDYPDCTAIAGNVTITSNDITNLNGLENLTSIGGRLWINDNDSLSVLGLANLTSVGGTLSISNNINLTSLTGLDNLTSIGGDFEINENNSLTSMSGLDNLTSIGQDMLISNLELNNLMGLESLITIGGDLRIGTYSMSSLSGLDNLTSVGGDLSIYSDLLINFTGLGGITSIGGNFVIPHIDSLTSFTGLENLDSIGGDLTVGRGGPTRLGNPALTSLTGLENLTYIGGDLSIFNNPNLTACAVQGICDYLANPNGQIFINFNAEGCVNQSQVDSACVTVSAEEITHTDKLLIYPNPSSTQITIELPNIPQKDAAYKIYNMNSQLVFSSIITSQKTDVDISGLQKGFYFVKLANDRTMSVGKLVKK